MDLKWRVTSLLLRTAVTASLVSRHLYTCCVHALWGNDSAVPILKRRTVLRLANDAAVDSRSPACAWTGWSWGLGCVVRAAQRLNDVAYTYMVARRVGLTSAPWPRYLFPSGAVEIAYTAYDFSFLGRPVTVVIKREREAGSKASAEPEGQDEEASALVAASLHGAPHLLASLWKTCFGSGIDASDFFDRFGASMRVPKSAGLRLGDLVFVAHALGCAPPRLLAATLLATSQTPPFHVDITSLNTGSSYVVCGRGGDKALPALPVFD